MKALLSAAILVRDVIAFRCWDTHERGHDEGFTAIDAWKIIEQRRIKRD